jgi:hypothetical protein
LNKNKYLEPAEKFYAGQHKTSIDNINDLINVFYDAINNWKHKEKNVDNRVFIIILV